MLFSFIYIYIYIYIKYLNHEQIKFNDILRNVENIIDYI